MPKNLNADKKIEKMDTEEYSVYTYNGVTYVPHYTNKLVYVGPAYDKTKIAYSGQFLERHGAKKESMFLWKRGTTGNVANVRT
jgi:hypothetical protein